MPNADLIPGEPPNQLTHHWVSREEIDALQSTVERLQSELADSERDAVAKWCGARVDYGR